ncbi:hypothetical protein AEMCBJ_12770 [Cupriavidus necator]|uniref:MobA/MobL family protein n=1 Tax=Cupriavidus necator TaxID=106590 RepID=UPI003F735020
MSHGYVPKGRSNGAAHAAYVQGEGKYADRDDVRAVVDGNLPAWACGDAYKFFAAADANERKNGRAYLEVEAAIPREAADPVAWAREFTQSLLGDRFAYRLAVHDRQAGDGGRNIHLHLMFSDRPTDGEHFDAKRFFKRNGSMKDRSWNKRDKVHEVRWLFAKHVREVVPGWEPPAPAKPEPKIGPALPKAGTLYHQARTARLAEVEQIRIERRQEAEREKIRDDLAEATKDLCIPWEVDLSQLERRLNALLTMPLQPGQQADLRELRHKAELERRRREAETRQKARELKNAAQHGCVRDLLKIALYARYCELEGDSAGGKRLRAEFQREMRNTPVTLRKRADYTQALVVRLAAEELLRDGLIGEGVATAVAGPQRAGQGNQQAPYGVHQGSGSLQCGRGQTGQRDEAGAERCCRGHHADHAWRLRGCCQCGRNRCECGNTVPIVLCRPGIKE